MKLRVKIALILLAVFVAYSALDYLVQRLVVMPSFVALEREQAERNLNRAVQAIDRELQHLSPTVNDWAAWDDTYQFVQDRNQGYIDSNLNPATLTSLRINVMNFYDTRGKLVWGLSIDLDSEEEIDLGRIAGESLPTDHVLLTHPTIESETLGILPSPGGPLLVASRPILTNERKGPSMGTVVMARLLDQRQLARIGEQAQVRLSSLPLAEGAGADTWEKASDVAHTPFELEEERAVTHVRTTLADLAARPVLRIQVDTPREVTARGEEALRFASLSLLGSGVLVLLVLMYVLKRVVLDPATALTRHAVAVGERGDLSARLALERKDEFGVLARELDRMVERLAEARRKLMDQSYHSGISEMASGVLHNIGNAITPLGVKLGRLSQRLREAPARELEAAAAELAQPGSSEDRRADLSRFVELAGLELAKVVGSAPAELAAIEEQVVHVHQILVDQQQYARAARVLEPVALDDLCAETARLLPEDLHRAITLEIEPSLKEVGPVLAARVALQQILSNLFINAAESVRAAGRDGGGRLRLSASREQEDGMQRAHVRVEDNGRGIRPEQMARLFERGYTTKTQGSSGLGLHWSATTAASMSGRLYAESAGEGQGACLHLLLPLAADRPAAAPGETQ